MAWTDTGVQLGECYSYQAKGPPGMEGRSRAGLHGLLALEFAGGGRSRVCCAMASSAGRSAVCPTSELLNLLSLHPAEFSLVPKPLDRLRLAKL